MKIEENLLLKLYGKKRNKYAFNRNEAGREIFARMILKNYSA